MSLEPDSVEQVYDGRRFDVVVERWGKRVREIVEPPDAAAIVAVDTDGYITLVRQFREAARADVLELPAGLLEPGESPLECAKRELVEETGLTGGTWRQVASFYPAPGFSRERIDLFVAEDLQQGTATPDTEEEFELVRVPVAEVADLLAKIEDGKTLAGLLLYLRERPH
jgi:ADP-ribose pyrophosphatase